MKNLIGAAAVFTLATAATLPAGAMEQELSMLELAAESALNTVGVKDVDVVSLSLSQLAQIQGIISGDESDNDKKRRIEAIIAR